MKEFNIVNHESEINLSSDWRDSAKFDSKNTIVTQSGRQYKLIAKKERTLSISERALKGVLGIFPVCLSLGSALLSQNIRELFSKEKEVIRFAIIYNPPIEKPAIINEQNDRKETEPKRKYKFVFSSEINENPAELPSSKERKDNKETYIPKFEYVDAGIKAIIIDNLCMATDPCQHMCIVTFGSGKIERRQYDSHKIAELIRAVGPNNVTNPAGNAHFS